jgi:predicted Zn-dependent peptidase
MLGARVLRTPTACRNFSSVLRATEKFTFGVVDSTARAPAAAVTTATTNASGIKINTVDNGSSSVTLSFSLVGAGSRSEGPHELGYAQLLAATAFTGSSTQTGLRAMRTLEDHGAKVHASASRDAVTYHVSCMADKVDGVTAVIADAITNPVTEDKYYYIGEGRGALKALQDRHFASGFSQLDDALHEAAYGAGSPLGGATHDPRALTSAVDPVMAFRARTFVPGNLHVCGTGVSHSALSEAVDKHFRFHSGGKNALPATQLPPSPYVGGDVKVRTSSEKAWAGIAFPVPAGAAAGAYYVLHSALSQAAPAGTRVFHNQYADGGILGFKVEGDSAADASKALEGAIASLKAVAAAGVTDAAVKNATLGVGDHAALVVHALTGTGSRGATAAQAAAAAKALLAVARPAYAVYGATAGSASYEAVKNMLK